jgi:hypothetical protein
LPPRYAKGKKAGRDEHADDEAARELARDAMAHGDPTEMPRMTTASV